MDVKIAIVGSRSFADYDLLKRYVCERIAIERIGAVISGGAKGADRLAEQFAREHGKTLVAILPDWERYGRKAGPLRNRKIVETADIIFAFWDGASPGTRGTIRLAETIGKPVHCLRFQFNARRSYPLVNC